MCYVIIFLLLKSQSIRINYYYDFIFNLFCVCIELFIMTVDMHVLYDCIFVEIILKVERNIIINQISQTWAKINIS